MFATDSNTLDQISVWCCGWMCGFVVGVGCGPPDAPDAPGTSGRLDGRICTVGTVDTVAFGHRRGAFWGRAQGAPGGAMGAPWTPGAPGIRGSGMGTDKGPDLGAVGTMGTPWRVPGATVGTWFGTGRAGGTHQGHRGAGRVWARFAQLVGASGVRGLGCWSVGVQGAGGVGACWHVCLGVQGMRPRTVRGVGAYVHSSVGAWDTGGVRGAG